MTRIYTLILLFASLSIFAQERYLDSQYGIEVTKDVVFGNNKSILRGLPAMDLDLMMDVYAPIDDDNTSRPVMLVAHTGSFLPPLFSGQITGSRSDSTVVYTCTELAKRGYVAVAYTYRQGWLPASTDQNVRTGTLLQAAYRGIQDTRTCVRYMRKSVAEDGNPYNVDTENIGVVGIGTGGYLALGAGSFYEFDEINIDKFIDTETALPYIDTTILGNSLGDTDAALCTANHPGYSSDIDFSFNIGGALGDSDWIDGEDREPMFAGVHATNDVFAPYGDGPVIVPVTEEFVVNVSGTWSAIKKANEVGNNDRFADILNDPLKDLIEAQKPLTFPLPLAPTIMHPVGMDNFYGFVTPFPQGSPWDWWDKATLDQVVAGTNAVAMTNFNADTLHRDALLTNFDMSAEKGRIYMDTIFQLMLPRACVALDLACTGILSAENLVEHEVAVYPNPAVDQISFEVGDAIIQNIQIMDISGRLMSTNNNINKSYYVLDRGSLENGVYIANLFFEDGMQSIKILFE